MDESSQRKDEVEILVVLMQHIRRDLVHEVYVVRPYPKFEGKTMHEGRVLDDLNNAFDWSRLA